MTNEAGLEFEGVEDKDKTMSDKMPTNLYLDLMDLTDPERGFVVYDELFGVPVEQYTIVHNNPDYHVIKKSDVDVDVMGALSRMQCTIERSTDGGDYKDFDIIRTFIERAALSKTEWLPISSAPKDGTIIQVYNPKGEGYNGLAGEAENGGICIARWLNYGFNDASWYLIHCCDGVSYVNPTHWMPLPTPPKGESQKG